MKDKDVKFISSFNFQSSGSTNHANCIQFDYSQHRDADPIVYISTHYRPTPCYVETITERGSEMMQSIYIEESVEVPSSMYFNLVAGEDGYLWLCGFYDNILRIIKYKKPDLSLQNVTLTSDDILDKWERTDYVWEEEVLQGMKCYGNHLYVAYGGSTGRRGLWIWDTITHKLEHNIEMSNTIKAEFEDVEIYDGYLYLFVLSDYILKFNLDSFR